MVPDSQTNLTQQMQFLAQEELSTLDPELFGSEARSKIKRREAEIKRYVKIHKAVRTKDVRAKDVRTLAYIASGIGDKGLATL